MGTSPEEYLVDEHGATKHFDHLFTRQDQKTVTPQPNKNAGGINFADEAPTGQAPRLEKDQFIKVYATSFQTASALTGFKSLHVDMEAQATLEGFGALYDTFLDIDMLHFLLEPGNKWWGRGFAIMALFAPMASGASKEMDERKKPKPKTVDATKTEAPKKPEEKKEGELSEDERATLVGI